MSRRSGKRFFAGPAASCVLVLALSVVLAVLLVAVGAAYQRDDLGGVSIGTFRDAEKVALDLEELLRPGDAVYTHWAANVPLEYYFRKHGISPDFLGISRPPGMEEVRRVFFVTAEMEGHTLGSAKESAASVGYKDTLFEESWTVVVENDHSMILESQRREVLE